jgi:hypothetical protein
MNKPETKMLGQDPAIRLYMVLCLSALTVVLIVLLQSGYGRWSLFPVVIGVLGVVFRWRSGVLVFLIALTTFFLMEHGHLREGTVVFRFRRQPTLFDWGLGASCLAFVMAYYRLQGLVVAVFPQDPRRLRMGEKRSWVRRPTHLVSQREVGMFFVSLPVWAALAQVLWRLILSRPVLDLPPRLGHLVLVGWMLGVGLLVVAGLLSYLAQQRLTPEEATLFLQDALWWETRREQRRVHQWLIWDRLRRLRRKEQS